MDALLLSQSRFGLLLGNLVLSAFLAYLAFRHMTGLGVKGFRRTYWSLLILAGGAGVYLLYRLIETNRAYRAGKVIAPEDAPPMLIS